MSDSSSKARFYLEQAVPQLQEFKSKKIFLEEEIKVLVKKRSDFEHKIASRGCQPVDFAKYAAWEIGLEKLRQKRCKRLCIKNFTHRGQAKIFNIFERGTKRHPGDVALWMSYLEYTKAAKANKKFKAVLTSVIRLHPTKPELWLYAAKWSLESEVDINGARSYMQRGTRFCTSSTDLWIEHAKLEMIYIAKVELRRKILRIDERVPRHETTDPSPENGFEFSNQTGEIKLPDFKSQTLPSHISDTTTDINEQAIKDPIKSPALNGAIPIAIFDAAVKQSFFCPSVAARFFDMFSEFSEVRCLPKIIQHIVDEMLRLYPINHFTADCYTRQPFICKNRSSPEFPPALGLSLQRFTESFEKVTDKDQYSELTRAWMMQILNSEKLDSAIKTVLEHKLRKLGRGL
ncbi:U3 small nucleolar RNA-associated protein 6 [Golovinomyces cichoracearum]|uniref:U3 small nucleolar RNA-associated protein 6 n=1 Tax=Golovinomyces cichoracearum TaxID=62708 RepID=A0A420IAU3_9PEZI|nr:U3 small nucleolar RNA-associated protein 6 [Golovinomyces cichoracearum]